MIIAATVPASSTRPTVPFNYRVIWLISLVAAMGGFLFGYDWVVIGGAKPFFEQYFQLNNQAVSGWANSCALLGCLIGALTAGGLSDRFGRKKLLLASAFLFAISSVLTGRAMTFNAFVAWRILGGVAIGIASALSPMYIAEIAPAHLRGRLVSLNQLTIVLGILAAQIVNWRIAEPVPPDATADAIRLSWNGQMGWRWMFIAVAVPSIFFFIGSLLVPESPRWLIRNGQPEKAKGTLIKIGGEIYADAEVREVQSTLAKGETQRVNFRDLLERRTLKILLTGCVLAVLQQWSGINVVFNYAEDIFKAAGYGISSILFNIVITGVVMLVFTVVAIQTVDKFGRRFLMLTGCAGIALSHAVIGISYWLGLKGILVVAPVLSAIAFYSISLAPVTWVLISEIFPTRIRGAAVSIAVSALWIACFVLTYTFPLLNSAFGPALTFWLYAAICTAGSVFIFFAVPETKGKSLEQIEQDYYE